MKSRIPKMAKMPYAIDRRAFAWLPFLSAQITTISGVLTLSCSEISTNRWIKLPSVGIYSSVYAFGMLYFVFVIFSESSLQLCDHIHIHFLSLIEGATPPKKQCDKARSCQAMQLLFCLSNLRPYPSVLGSDTQSSGVSNLKVYLIINHGRRDSVSD